MLTGALLARIGNQAADGVQLVITREDEDALAGLFAGFVFLLVLVNKILQQVQDAVPRPDLFPQIGGGKAAPGGRVACAQVIALVEGDEAGLFPLQPGGKIDPFRVHGKVCQAAPVGKQGFAGIAGGAVLADGIFHRLSVERIL